MEPLAIGRARPQTATTVRQRIKDGIASSHDRLDAKVAAACLSPRPDARRLLAVHALALPPIVAGLLAAGAARLWPGWDGPERLALLAAELGPGPLPGASFPPEHFRDEAAVWGGLYALLGSRLGNKVIRRRLVEGGEPGDSAFLRPGPDDGPEWRRFLDALEAALRPTMVAGAIEGAALVMGRYVAAVERIGQTERTGGPCP